MDVGRQGRISHIRWATHIDPLGPPVGVDCLLVAHGRLPTGEQPIPSDGPHTWLCNTICDCMCGCIYVGVYGCIWMSVHVCGYVCARASGCGCGCGCVCMLYRCILPGPSPPGQEVKRSRGQGVMGVMGRLPTRTLTDPSHTMAARQLASCADRAQQGPVLPRLPSPLPSDRHRPSPSANWRTGQPPAASPTLPPTLPQLPPPGRGQSPPGPGPGPRPVCQRVGFRARQSDESNEPWQTWTRLDSTRLELASTRAPCDTLPPPP